MIGCFAEFSREPSRLASDTGSALPSAAVPARTHKHTTTAVAKRFDASPTLVMRRTPSTRIPRLACRLPSKGRKRGSQPPCAPVRRFGGNRSGTNILFNQSSEFKDLREPNIGFGKPDDHLGGRVDRHITADEIRQHDELGGQGLVVRWVPRFSNRLRFFEPSDAARVHSGIYCSGGSSQLRWSGVATEGLLRKTQSIQKRPNRFADFLIGRPFGRSFESFLHQGFRRQTLSTSGIHH